MAYPTIFISGSCDITIPKLVKLDVQDWIEHIYYCIDNRVCAHPYLKFFLLNLRLRRQALSQGSFVVSQQLNDAHLTIQQLQQNLNNNDDSVPRKTISMVKNFANTDPYWKAKKKKLDALTLFHRKEYSHISKETIEDVKHKFATDTSFRYKLIMRNNHIVTHYFDTRLLNYMCSVGVELFDFYDYWFRYEFAAGRGMIHSHGVIFSPSHAEKIHDALNSFSASQTNANSNVAIELEKILQSTEYNDESFNSPEFVSMHPAGGEIINDEWCPNIANWSKLEGTAVPAVQSPLEKTIDSVMTLIIFL